MASVYCSSDVDAVDQLFEYLWEQLPADVGIEQLLDEQAKCVLQAHRDRQRAAYVMISNHYKPLAGVGVDKTYASPFSLDDARLVMARDHGFSSWKSVIHESGQLDEGFEEAIDALVHGEFRHLKLMLKEHPQLVTMQSSYGHRATLLHYVAANGTEIRRQKVPSNAPEMAQLLLEFGANVDAKAKVYGGEFDTAALLSSSAHPKEAGVARDIAYVLTKAGATFSA